MPGHDDFLDDYIAYKICCEDDDDDSSDGCYIATAVYGTYDCPELWVLRRFRDYGLRKSIIGTAFVRFYYAVSPRLVRRLECIGEHIVNVLYADHCIALLRLSAQFFTFTGSSNQYSFSSGMSSYSTIADSA